MLEIYIDLYIYISLYLYFTSNCCLIDNELYTKLLFNIAFPDDEFNIDIKSDDDKIYKPINNKKKNNILIEIYLYEYNWITIQYKYKQR